MSILPHEPEGKATPSDAEREIARSLYLAARDGSGKKAISLIAQALAAATTPPPVGYIIAERHTFGPNEGKLDADWDGEIHASREAADAELAQANDRDGSCCDGAHWKLYELRPVGNA